VGGVLIIACTDVGSLDGHWDGLMGLIIADLNVHMGFLWSVVMEQELFTFYLDHGCAVCSLVCVWGGGAI